VSPWATEADSATDADGWALAAPVADTVGRGEAEAEADREDDGDDLGRGGTFATVGSAATAASTGLPVQGEAAVPPHPAAVVCWLAAVRPDAAPGESRLLAR
jgi:hypothetical protein